MTAIRWLTPEEPGRVQRTFATYEEAVTFLVSRAHGIDPERT